MDKEAKNAVVEFALRCLNTAIHEEVKGNLNCQAISLTGFVCSRAEGHEGPHIAGGNSVVYHIWQYWEEKRK